MEKEDFTLDFVSSDGIACSEGEHFSIRLGKTIRLDPAVQWEVALKRGTRHRHFDTLHSVPQSSTIFAHWHWNYKLPGDNRVISGGNRRQHVFLPAFNSVHTPQDVIHLLYNALDDVPAIQSDSSGVSNISFSLWNMADVTFNTYDKKYYISLKENNIYHAFQFVLVLMHNKNGVGLTNTLGIIPRAGKRFTSRWCYIQDNVPVVCAMSDVPTNILRNQNLIDIRCNIAGRSSHMNTSNSLGLFPLVAWLQEEGTDLPIITKEIKHPFYLPVIRTEISVVSFNLVCHSNQEKLWLLPKGPPTFITLFF